MLLKKGINLGGWLSQCEPSIDHYESFIKEEDFKIISNLGFDHVRVPVDYNLVEEVYIFPKGKFHYFFLLHL